MAADPAPRPRIDDAHLAACMAGMAAGDHAFLWAFLETFGDRLAGVVRSVLLGFGRHDLARDADTVDALVLDAAFVLLGRAGGWRPGGARPWTWAYPAVAEAVASAVGHRTVELDPERHGDPAPPAPPAAGGSVSALALLDRLAGRDPRVRDFAALLERHASERDRAVVAEYLVQQAQGDPSPSHTVADLLGLTAVNVRQIVARVRSRMRRASSGAGGGWLAA